jgi:prepilin-type N-terminal cleavage/methylation domain-containing protein
MRQEDGFSLLEMLVSTAVLSIVCGTALTATLRLTTTNDVVNNRTEMHAAVRNATELLQQEVGQAGRISLPAAAWLTAAVAPGTIPVNVSSATGMFIGEKLVIDTGANEETVTLTNVTTNPGQITATFVNAHAVNAPVNVYGGFMHGIVPKNVLNGSTDFKLKMFGDIDGNGEMVYVEFECDVNGGNLYRRTMPFTANVKPALSASQVLLTNLEQNPNNEPCFVYQPQPANGQTFVVDVAITLTVKTARKDPITGLDQTETKALLNVSPRNVFNVWQMAGLGLMNRVQPTPATVTALLGQP